MVKVASILAALYLCLAPGMDVGRLLHSVELCRFFDAVAVDAHDHQHDHSEDSEAPDCPHHVIVETGVLPTVAAPSSVQPQPAFLLPRPLEAASSPDTPAHVKYVERPPPGPLRAGITLLLI
jgi:hypothetical protein